MTPKIIELKQAPVVLVELPDAVANINIEITPDEYDTRTKPMFYLVFRTMYVKDVTRISVPYKSYILGMLSDLTEDQFAECVDIDDDYGVVLYRNYRTTAMPYYDEQINAKQSFLSLLESENVYTENPYGDEPTYTVISYGVLSDGTVRFRKDHDKWQEAQSRTIDPSRTIVLIRKGERI